jgi:hypothetical protein
MKAFLLLAFCLAFFSACNSTNPSGTRPEDYFSAGQQKSLLLQLVLKTTKPDHAMQEAELSAWYQEQLNKTEWWFAHEKDGGFYFLITRPAPSLYGKRMAIGGFFRSPDQMRIQGFKEQFHTFKMKPEVLREKSALLFEKMVNGEDLSPYYHSRAKTGEEWIEFPDDLFQYDSLKGAWVMRGM